ncbi:MAG: gamma-glutamyl-gamma-aminobutyrate hydrolase family protein [Planctomycetia bacterium]|nr:gamma-glutamyl-gamma-aminobutyrate hydrolase family protein [Planctomycetia bacterium]
MFDVTSSIRIGIYGTEEETAQDVRNFALWSVGYAGTIKAASATPVFLPEKTADLSWKEILHDIDGVVLGNGHGQTPQHLADSEELVRFCREHQIPLLAIDHGMLALNLALGGSLHTDLPRELPEALQHRHPPEKGLRHAINVIEDTYLADLYGEGEVVVNSEHRQAVQRIARGFRVSATALDGVVEAIEHEKENWWVLGVQWRPASASASGLDIQVFRGLINACEARATQTADEDTADLAA